MIGLFSRCGPGLVLGVAGLAAPHRAREADRRIRDCCSSHCSMPVRTRPAILFASFKCPSSSIVPTSRRYRVRTPNSIPLFITSSSGAHRPNPLALMNADMSLGLSLCQLGSTRSSSSANSEARFSNSNPRSLRASARERSSLRRSQSTHRPATNPPSSNAVTRSHVCSARSSRGFRRALAVCGCSQMKRAATAVKMGIRMVVAIRRTQTDTRCIVTLPEM